MTVSVLLWKRVAARDFDSLAGDLADLSAAEHAEARAWYSEQWKSVRRYYSGGTDFAVGQQSSAWTESLLAAHLAGPTAAAQRVRWNDLWWHEEEEYLERFCAALVGRGRDWCAMFVPAASGVRIERRHLFERVSTLHRVLSLVIEEHHLEVPSGEAFVHGWMLSLPPMPDLVDAWRSIATWTSCCMRRWRTRGSATGQTFPRRCLISWNVARCPEAPSSSSC